MRRYLFSLVFVLIGTMVFAKDVKISLVKSVPPGTDSSGTARVIVMEEDFDWDNIDWSTLDWNWYFNYINGYDNRVPNAYYEEDLILRFIWSYGQIDSVVIWNDNIRYDFGSNDFDSIHSPMIPLNFLEHNTIYNLSIRTSCESENIQWWEGSFCYKTPYADYTETMRGISGYQIYERQDGINNAIYGLAGNSISGRNYGVVGMLEGKYDGIGIYGSSSFEEELNTGGRYAGLFHGDVRVTDAVNASVYNTLADSRLERNIKKIEGSVLDDIMGMTVYSFDMDQAYVENGDNSTSVSYYNNDSKILDTRHYGLSGQEIGLIYPDLVSADKNGLVSINYVEMIPLLIQAIQELKSELNAAQTELADIRIQTRVESRSNDQAALLYQNAPNPFREGCVIKCVIPQNATDAVLYIFDVNGHQIDSISISERGNASIIINGNKYEAGIYLYSLVVDGNLIDTKRMIITK